LLTYICVCYDALAGDGQDCGHQVHNEEEFVEATRLAEQGD